MCTTGTVRCPVGEGGSLVDPCGCTCAVAALGCELCEVLGMGGCSALGVACCSACPSCLASMANRGNFAKSFGPKRWGLTLFSAGDRWSLGEMSSNSISTGVALAFLTGGWSSHRCICSSFPCPSRRLGLERGGVGVVVVVCGVLCCCCKPRNLSGSAWWWGQTCQGIPHEHCHCLTKRDFLQLLHHSLVSRLWLWKAALIPGRRCGHLGHLK